MRLTARPYGTWPYWTLTLMGHCFGLGPKQLCALGHLGCALVFILIVTIFDLKSFEKAIRLWWFILM